MAAISMISFWNKEGDSQSFKRSTSFFEKKNRLPGNVLIKVQTFYRAGCRKKKAGKIPTRISCIRRAMPFIKFYMKVFHSLTRIRRSAHPSLFFFGGTMS